MKKIILGIVVIAILSGCSTGVQHVGKQDGLLKACYEAWGWLKPEYPENQSYMTGWIIGQATERDSVECRWFRYMRN